MQRGDVLDQARLAVTVDKAEEHGDPMDVLGLASMLWNDYLGMSQISVIDVAMMLALLKIARQRYKPGNADNYVDMAGYGSLAAEMAVLTPNNVGSVEVLEDLDSYR